MKDTSRKMADVPTTVTIDWEQFCALMKIAGQQIDPATAEVSGSTR